MDASDREVKQMRRVGSLTWLWVKTHAVTLGSLVVGAGIGAGILILAAVASVRDTRESRNSQKVACDWRQAIMALGISPVFPPSEDLHVGDIIAVRELGNEKPCDTDSSDSILFRTMGIAHVPETEAALQRRYKDIPKFRPTPEKYDGTSPVSADGDIFAAPGILKSLPIVGFPGITLATANAETVGLGVLSGIRAFFSGATRAASESVQIRIPEAETYGLGAADSAFVVPVRVGPRNQSLERLIRSRRHEVGDPLHSKTRPEVEARWAQIALGERQTRNPWKRRLVRGDRDQGAIGNARVRRRWRFAVVANPTIERQQQRPHGAVVVHWVDAIRIDPAVALLPRIMLSPGKQVDARPSIGW